MAESVFILAGLLTVGFLSIRPAQSARIPHSVFLVLLGGATGLAIRAMHPEWGARVSSLFPEIILYVLLPPLIFESAYNMNFSDLKKDFVPIMVLAVIGLVISAVLVGVGMNRLLGFPLLACLLFGALISATDPVAVVSLFKELGAPKRLTMLVEGESLFNDGSAIVLFQVLLAAALAPATTLGAATVGLIAKNFIVVFFGGVLVGLVVAIITSLLLRLIPTGSGQMGMTVAAAYLSFIVADHVFHVSGVMSTVPVGVYLGNRARLEFNKEALHGMKYLWEFLALAANIIVFFGVGLTVEPGILKECLKYIPAVLLIVYAARVASVYMTVPVMNVFKMTEHIPGSYQGILIWGGLRGGLALALVLLIQDTFEYKQLFLGLATSVVLATLLINALTIKSAMHLFGLDRLSDREENLLAMTMHKLHHHLYRPLQKAAREGILSAALVNKNQQDAEEIIAAGARQTTPGEEAFDFEFRNLLLSEKAYYDKRLEDGVLSKRAYQRLLHLIRFRFDAYETGGERAAVDYPFEIMDKDPLAARILAIAAPKMYHNYRVRNLTLILEECLHLEFAIQDALNEVEHESVRHLAEGWLERIAGRLHYFFTLYPHYGTSIQALYIANRVAARSEKSLDSYVHLDLISGGIYARAKEYVSRIHHQEVGASRAYLNPAVSYLLKRIPLFSAIPAGVIDELAAGSKIHEMKPEATVVREGDPGESIFLVTTGLLEVSGSHVQKTRTSKLFTGDVIGDPKIVAGEFFGEVSLLTRAPRTATVKTLTDATLVEINHQQIEKIMEHFPEVKASLEATAKNRMSTQKT